MALATLRRHWLQQPQLPVRPRRRFSSAIIIHPGQRRVLSAGTCPTTDPYGVGPCEVGVGAAIPAGGDSKIIYPVNSLDIGTGDFTLAVEVTIRGSFGAGYKYACGTNTSLAFSMANKGIGGRAGIYLSSATIDSGTTTNTPGRYRIVVRRVSGVVYFRINDYSSSVAGAQNVGTISTVYLNSFSATTGAYGLGDAGPAWITCYALDTRPWTDAETDAFVRNPWGLLAEPAREVVVLPVAGGGPITIAPSPVSAVSLSSMGSISLGSIVVSGGVASAAASSAGPAVVQGGQTVSPQAAAAIVEASAGVVLGSLSVSAGQASSVAASVAPGVVLGSVTVSPDAVSAVAKSINPTVDTGSGVSVLLDPASAVAMSAGAGAVLGSLVVSLSPAAALALSQDPTAVLGSLVVALSSVSAVAKSQGASAVLGNVSVLPSPAGAVARALFADLVLGSVVVSLQPVSAITASAGAVPYVVQFIQGNERVLVTIRRSAVLRTQSRSVVLSTDKRDVIVNPTLH